MSPSIPAALATGWEQPLESKTPVEASAEAVFLEQSWSQSEFYKAHSYGLHSDPL